MKLDQFSFYIIPGCITPDYPHRSLYNSAYQYYKNTWERIFNRPNRPPQYNPSSFHRQDYIFQINNGDEVVAQTLATHYYLDLAMTEELGFFENFLGEPIEFLKSHQANALLSLEYSSIAKEYSPREVGVNLYKVIIQLAMKSAKALETDAVFGHPRRLTKTNELIELTGCKCLGERKNKYGVSVDLFAGLTKELVDYDDPPVNELISMYWNHRIDTTGKLSNKEIYPLNPLEKVGKEAA